MSQPSLQVETRDYKRDLENLHVKTKQIMRVLIEQDELRRSKLSALHVQRCSQLMALLEPHKARQASPATDKKTKRLQDRMVWRQRAQEIVQSLDIADLRNNYPGARHAFSSLDIDGRTPVINLMVSRIEGPETYQGYRVEQFVSQDSEIASVFE